MDYKEQLAFYDRAITQNRTSIKHYLTVILDASNGSRDGSIQRLGSITSATQFIEACAQNIRQLEADRYKVWANYHLATCDCSNMDADEVANGMRCELCYSHGCC